MRRRVVLFGGSFDPVHYGHVALANYFLTLLASTELRLIPAGQPWQKPPLQANPEQRSAMLRRAFDLPGIEVVIDTQEIERIGASYSIDTVKQIRAEVGPEAALALVLGADQLRQLDSWRDWQQLFDYVHIGAAARPGFDHAYETLPPVVAREFKRRAASANQLRNSAHGLTYCAANLAQDIAASTIRALLRQPANDAAAQAQLGSALPGAVLDYIRQHHLYQ